MVTLALLPVELGREPPQAPRRLDGGEVPLHGEQPGKSDRLVARVEELAEPLAGRTAKLGVDLLDLRHCFG